mgnify:CR=1 FL=1
MTVDLQPHLVGELVELRPITESDWDALYAVASDPLIWEQHPAHDRHERDVFKRYFDDAIASGSAFVVIDRATSRIIGSTRYHGLDLEKSEIEIGWTFLARSHWGGRFNADMKRLLLDHVFQFVDTVVLLIGPDNTRSQRAAERIGAVRDGEITRPDRHGRPMVNWRYALRRPVTTSSA